MITSLVIYAKRVILCYTPSCLSIHLSVFEQNHVNSSISWRIFFKLFSKNQLQYMYEGWRFLFRFHELWPFVLFSHICFRKGNNCKPNSHSSIKSSKDFLKTSPKLCLKVGFFVSTYVTYSVNRGPLVNPTPAVSFLKDFLEIYGSICSKCNMVVHAGWVFLHLV